MSDSNVIGRQLEESVRKIEMAILKTSPHLKDEPLLIESNKIAIVDGARLDLDAHFKEWAHELSEEELNRCSGKYA